MISGVLPIFVNLLNIGTGSTSPTMINVPLLASTSIFSTPTQVISNNNMGLSMSNMVVTIGIIN